MEIIKRNWKIKLLSLAAAIFLWSYIIGTTNPTVSVRLNDVPIVYENLDDLENRGYILDPTTQKTVNLRVSGQRSSIVNLTNSHIRTVADFSRLDEGVHSVPIRYSTPDGIVLNDYPNELIATIDKIVNKEMLVEVNPIGNLAENFLIQSSTISPEKISIRGARPNVDRIAKLVVDLDMNTLERNITINKEVKAVDAAGNPVEGITFGQEFVNLNVLVDLQKEVPIDIETAGELKDNLKLEARSLNRTSVLIRGPVDVISRIERISTQDIDLSNLEDSASVNVRLELPSDVRLVNPDLDYSVDFELEKKIDKTLTIATSKVNIINNTDNRQINISGDNINVVLNGFASDLEGIEAEDIDLEINAQTLNQGANQVVPSIKLNGTQPKEGLIKNIEKLTINVD